VCHTDQDRSDEVLSPLLGFSSFDGPSIRTSEPDPVYNATFEWVQRSAQAGHKWIVTSDENNNSEDGVVPDDADPTHDSIRKYALWGNIMAGGA
jgi:hypothetical protein